jgi:hypothetical protein
MATHDPRTSEICDTEVLLEWEPDHIDSERMFNRVSEKIGLSATATSATTASSATAPTRGASGTHKRLHTRRRPLPVRRWKTALIAAAIVVTLPLLTGAGVYLATGENPIDYAFRNPSPEQTPFLEEGGIPIHGIEMPNLELFNAPIGQAVESAGVTVTLDTIAIDDNFVSVFFTYEFDEPVDLDTAVAEGWVGVDAINLFAPQPTIWANGEMIGDGQNRESKESTTYFADEARTVVKQTTRYMIPGWLPDDLEIKVSLAPFTSTHVYRSALQETISFEAQINKSAASAQTRGVAPGQYAFDTADGERILDIEKLALTPFGAVLTIRTHWTDEGTWDGRYLRIQDLQFSAPSDAQITRIARFSYRQATPEDDFISVELLARYGNEMSGRTEVLPYDITDLTIAPLKRVVTAPKANVDPGGGFYERNLYSLSDIGADMPTSPTGGLVLKNVEVEGSRLIITAETYGDCQGAELVPQDEGIITLTAQNRAGLLTSSYDAATRIFTQITDYYAATEDEIRNIATISVGYNEFIGYDDAGARTFEFTIGHPKRQ